MKEKMRGIELTLTFRTMDEEAAVLPLLDVMLEEMRKTSACRRLLQYNPGVLVTEVREIP